MTKHYKNWGTLTDYGPTSNPTSLYEYGQIALLHQGAGVQVPPIHWGATTFTGTDEIWGLAFDWPKELIADHEFVFQFKFDLLPDLILADDNILWTRSRDAAAFGRVVLSYVPSSTGKVTLRFIKDSRFCDPVWPKMGIRFASGAGCLHGGQTENRAYERYSLNSLKTTTIEPLLTNRDFFQAPLLEPDLLTIEPTEYKSMELTVLHETLEAYLPEVPSRLERATPELFKEVIDRIPLLEANGFNGMIVYHLSDDLLEALAKSGLRHFIVETCAVGEWWLEHDGIFINRSRYDLGLDHCNRLLSRIPDAQVYFWFAEVEDREQHFFESPGFKKTNDQIQDETGQPQYGNFTDNEFWREETLAQANRQWKTELLKKVTDPSRVQAVYQAGSPLTIMRFKNAGADLTVNKAIFRGAFNITVAAGRGNAKVRRQPLGLDYDPWTWQFRMTHHPHEWRQGLLVYLHAGCNFLYHEGTLFRRDTDGRVKSTETGQQLCQIVRYARRHPAVGKSIVKMAAVKGSGECSGEFQAKFMPQLPYSGEQPDWVSLRFRDFSLLDIFFPNFGQTLRGNLQRFMTGTPYGPLDIVPWDARFEDLQEYDFLFLLGSNGCDEEQLQTLIQYVENGGKLLLASGQLRQKGIEPRQTIEHDFSANADIVHTFPDGAHVLHQRRGKGEVFLITTNTLTTLGEDQPRQILTKWAQQSAFLHFEPFSDWLEVMVNRKGQTVSLCLFNHGQIGFPSGNGPKTPPWQGTLQLDLDKLNLPTSVAVKQVLDGCRLQNFAFTIEQNRLMFDATIDYFSEFVIGPADRLEKDWYGID